MPGQELIFELRVEGQEAPVPVFLEGMGVEEARAVVTREVWWKVFVEPALQRIGKGTDGNGGNGRKGAVGDGGGGVVAAGESGGVAAGAGRGVATVAADGGAGGADAAVTG